MSGLRVIIIDDDIPMLRYLEKMVDWERIGCEEVKCFSSSQHALQVYSEWLPDIVITDIGMPQLDGMALAEKMKDVHPDFTLIFLTCHEEFHFARRAIGLQAEHYIIKDELSRKELSSLFEDICRKAIEQKHADSLIESREIEDQKAGFLKGIHSEHVIDAEMCMKQWTEESFRIALMHVKSFPFNKKNDNEKLKELYQSLTKQIKNNDRIHVFLYHGKLLFLMNYKENIKINDAGDFHDLLYSIQEQLFNKQIEVTLRIAKHAVNLEKLRMGINEITKVKKYGYYESSETPCFVDYQYQQVFHPMNHSLHDIIGSLLKASCDNDLSKVDVYLNELKKQAVSLLVNPEELEESILKLIYQLEVKKSSDSDTLDFAERLRASASIYETIRLTDEKIKSFKIETEASSISTADAPKLKVIDEYISSHLHETITSTDMANELYLNPSYFSRYFRKATGKRFTDYVYEYKIKIARDYLKYSHDSIEEIGSVLGFTERTYFSKVFKKYTGVTPSEFRSKTQLEQKEGAIK